GRRANLRPHPLRHILRAKAGLEHPPNPHRKPSRPHPRPRRLTDGLGVTVLRRFWPKPLKLQAYWPKNPGRSGSFLRNPLFLPLLPADSVRLDRPDDATEKRDKMGAVQAESIKRRKKGAGNLPQLLDYSRFRPANKILDRRQDPLDDDRHARSRRVHPVRLVEFRVARHAVEEERVEDRAGGLGDRRKDRVE